MTVEAVIVAALFSGSVETDIIPKLYFTLFNMVSIVSLVFLVDKSRYWPFIYLAGWILGIIISLDALIQTGFLGWGRPTDLRQYISRNGDPPDTDPHLNYILNASCICFRWTVWNPSFSACSILISAMFSANRSSFSPSLDAESSDTCLSPWFLMRLCIERVENSILLCWKYQVFKYWTLEFT